MQATMTVPTAEEIRADIRKAIAERGWTGRVEFRARLRFALALVAEGLREPVYDMLCTGTPADSSDVIGTGGFTLREERLQDD